ncbi:MAG: hypothetical protein ACJ76H_01290 [Bacteriovoracaceae bacterium]
MKEVSAQTELKDQIITDLITVGITGAATLTGNIPLAMASGVLSKYISTYGIQGTKALINKFKAEAPQDLGEINLYYVYLIHMKRNLYETLLNMRENVSSDGQLSTIADEIAKLEHDLSGSCSTERCEVTGMDQSLVNFDFINYALDAKQSFAIFDYLDPEQVKDTYQYLMLLYMDVIIVEQKLLESQYNVISNQVAELVDELDKNVYVSNEEKEYVFQLGMNMVLKWQRHRDHRRAVLLTALAKPLLDMETENEQLQEELDRYRNINDGIRKLSIR